MDVTVTVVRPASAAHADVRIVAADTALAGPLLDEIRRLMNGHDSEPIHAKRQVLDPASTVRDCDLVDGLVVYVGTPGGTQRDTQPESDELALAVVAGPDAGLRVPLSRPRTTVGRDTTCSLQLRDGAVSRCHLAVRCLDGELIIEDLGSRNGTLVDTEPLRAHDPMRVAVGQPIRIGNSELEVRRPLPTTPLIPSADGRFGVHRAPRNLVTRHPVEIRLPEAPEPPTPTRLPLLAALAPLVMGLLLAGLLHQWQFLAFTALSPVMIGGQALSDRTTSRRHHQAACARYRRELALARGAVHAASTAERASRHAASPDLAALTACAEERSDPLWQRGHDDPDALVLRLGRGEAPSDVTVAQEPPQFATDVPVCAPMRDIGMLGIAGPPAIVMPLARSLVIQAATLHGPGQCRIVIVAPGQADEWAWARWLPHTLPSSGQACTALVASDEEQAAARIAEIAASPPSETLATLLVVDTTTAAGSMPLDATVAARCCTVWVASDPAQLPAGCRAVITARDGAAQTLSVTGLGVSDLEVRPDLLRREAAEMTARALAPLRDRSHAAEAALPTEVPWSELVAWDLTDPGHAAAALTRAWSAGPSTVVPLGRGREGIVTIDLMTDGPHLLVAGTTGSGKSELLQTIVAGLAAANRPEDLALLLIDFKGGAAFGSCGRLPHTVGVVTDLDPGSARRALTSLEAELRHRERVLADVGAVDLDGYDEAATDAPIAAARPPRLVIIVDEFATLVEELPEFIGGLVGIAQRGRSLGVHLVLATQRPHGVVSADIRANTRLRIALAVTRDTDSRDVIDGPQAAGIGSGTPGRAYLRAGPGPLTVMQAARVRSCSSHSQQPTVTLSPGSHLGRVPTTAVGRADDLTDLDRLVDAAVHAAERIGSVLPAAPWLPPLRDDLMLGDLACVPADHAAWGVIDIPAQQRQPPLTVALNSGGTLVIAGTAGSGRTTAIRSLALAATAAIGPDRLQVWAIDGGGGLTSLDALPHCGGVVPADDVDRLDRLVSHVASVISRRRTAGWAGQPLLLLVVDGWEVFLARNGQTGDGHLVESLLQLAADGPAVGLHLVIGSGRTGLTGRLGAVTPNRLVLRLADRADYGLIGIPARDLPDDLPPGRAILSPALDMTQIALPDDATLTRALAWSAPCLATVRRFDPLPRHVYLDDLPTQGDDRALRLGLRADDHGTVRHDVRDGGALLVAGPPRSGRSTALVLLAHQLAGGQIAAICPRRSPLAQLGTDVGVVQLPFDDQEHALALLDAMTGRDGRAPTILVDDADLMPEGVLNDALCALGRTARDGRNIVVLAGPTDAFAAAFRGPVAEVRRGRAGVVLRPSGSHDGELLGVRLPRRDARHDPPGRGWWVVHGETTAIQVAMPGVSSSPARVPAAGWSPPAPAPPIGPCCGPPVSTRTTPGRPR